MSDKNPTIIFQPKPTSPRFQDLEGDRFHYLTVIGFAGTIKTNSCWYCSCKCGNTVIVPIGRLRNGKTKSCGCWNMEVLKRGRSRHGEAAIGKVSPEYRSFLSAANRCNNPKTPGYENYGGRGIRFLFSSFEDFLAEVGRRPTLKHSIDRIDTNGNYAVGNVRWATRKEQCRNRRNNHMLTINGRTACIMEWAEIAGSTKRTIADRVTAGWCSSCAVFNPIGVPCEHKTKKI